MESKEIPDTAITASSWHDYNTDFYGPFTARLNMQPMGPWIKHESDSSPWIQVLIDLDLHNLNPERKLIILQSKRSLAAIQHNHRHRHHG